MKYLKEGTYYVHVGDRVLRHIETQEDFGCVINDFEAFSAIGCDRDGDTIVLTIKDSVEDKGCGSYLEAYFYKYGAKVDLWDILKPDAPALPYKPENGTDQKDLTPEERIKQLEAEKAELELMVRQNEQYERFKKSTDEVALFRKAMMDSGFTREEAMNMLVAGVGAISAGMFKR